MASQVLEFEKGGVRITLDFCTEMEDVVVTVRQGQTFWLDIPPLPMPNDTSLKEIKNLTDAIRQNAPGSDIPWIHLIKFLREELTIVGPPTQTPDQKRIAELLGEIQNLQAALERQTKKTYEYLDRICALNERNDQVIRLLRSN